MYIHKLFLPISVRLQLGAWWPYHRNNPLRQSAAVWPIFIRENLVYDHHIRMGNGLHHFQPKSVEWFSGVVLLFLYVPSLCVSSHCLYGLVVFPENWHEGKMQVSRRYTAMRRSSRGHCDDDVPLFAAYIYIYSQTVCTDFHLDSDAARPNSPFVMQAHTE